MDQQNPSPALFFETVNAYERTEALRAAIELDLFTQVAVGKRTAEQIASACRASPRGVRILADYLTILGFLKQHGDEYEVTSDTGVFLNRQSPAYLGGALEFLLTPNLRECFEKLTEAVRRGGTVVSEEGTVSHDNPVGSNGVPGSSDSDSVESLAMTEQCIVLSHQGWTPMQNQAHQSPWEARWLVLRPPDLRGCQWEGLRRSARHWRPL